jgi:hypothetical protein
MTSNGVFEGESRGEQGGWSDDRAIERVDSWGAHLIATRVRFSVFPPIVPVYSEPPKGVAAFSSGRQPGDRDVCIPSIRAPTGREYVGSSSNGLNGYITQPHGYIAQPRRAHPNTRATSPSVCHRFGSGSSIAPSVRCRFRMLFNLDRLRSQTVGTSLHLCNTQSIWFATTFHARKSRSKPFGIVFETSRSRSM